MVESEGRMLLLRDDERNGKASIDFKEATVFGWVATDHRICSEYAISTAHMLTGTADKETPASQIPLAQPVTRLFEVCPYMRTWRSSQNHRRINLASMVWYLPDTSS